MGTVILRVTASDADSGNFALIEYSLGDGEGKFAIHPNTVSRPWGGPDPGSGKAQSPGLKSHQRHPHIPFLGPVSWTFLDFRWLYLRIANSPQSPRCC